MLSSSLKNTPSKKHFINSNTTDNTQRSNTMFKTIGFWIYDLYNFFFDLKINPLRHIPSPYTQFILMFYLSVMWSAIFTVWAGHTIYYGIYSVGGHLLVIGGFFITAMIFHEAEKNGHTWVMRNQLPDTKDRRCVWDLEKEG